MDSLATGGDTKAGFRKPSNDATNRKYRRRSPSTGSSSSDGSPRHDRSSSPMISKEDLSKDSDSRRRKADGRDMDRTHVGRNSDSYKSSRSSRGDYRRHDDHDRHKSYSDRTRQENDQYRSRDHLGNKDRNYSGHRSSRDNREKETLSTEHNKYKDSASHRTGSDNRDARKDYLRNSGDRKNNHSHLHEESRGHRSETSSQKNTDGHQSKEVSKVVYEEMNDEKNNKEEKKKDSENLGMGRTKDQGEHLVNSESPSKKAKFLGFEKAGGGQSSSLKQSGEVVVSKMTTQPALTSDDIDAAKVAAMKVAESVNRNLIGTGFMTADQKKKLLWGNKKNTVSEEQPGNNRWDSSLFNDREREEKFKKLMSLRLAWCIWPIIVGCKGRAEEDRSGSSRSSCRQAEGGTTAAGLGEAVHCWTSTQRWTHSWPWPLRIKIIFGVLFYKTYANVVIVIEMLFLPFIELLCHWTHNAWKCTTLLNIIIDSGFILKHTFVIESYSQRSLLTW
ncbi:pre-mRNA-splicing factor spp2-like isoform X1 [Impatiens glandulifera]|uniref:pre-mRNA-splicing factor spp2-like isoform X1 n=1 Tax=Impatiens glandulifera TaxID=253017 RepID=UPI001FB04B48|nr:pre-mRNA-splicing factor spp2-like isoform X1 [Impatiens glandulifera]